MKQHVQQEGIQFDGILKAGYDLAYTYSNEKPHQITNIQDDSYRTESDTIANDVIKRNHAYEYDKNGNLIYVNTSREKQDQTSEDKAQERKMLWNEENRLEAINTNGFISGYWYDASGERVIKTSGDDEGIYVNDVFSGGRTETANFTAYINPYLVVSKGGAYTKHIYIGSQRIVSKLGDLDSYGQDPRRIEYAGSNVDGTKVDYKSKYIASQQAIKDNYANFEVPYYGKDNDDYVNGQGFCCDDAPKLKSFNPDKNDNPELFQYYYHSDHLGSSSLITNLDGEVVQYVEYVPFGEIFLEERNNIWNTPYLFNAKELDEETGLYYYGARYYDPRISLWLSADPLQEKYPNISTYTYAFQNPIKFIDFIGMEGELAEHTVKSGDNLTSISKQYGVSVSSLVKWNNLKNPNNLKVGQSLLVDDPQKAIDKEAFDTYPDFGAATGYTLRNSNHANQFEEYNASNGIEVGIASQRCYDVCNLVGDLLNAVTVDPAMVKAQSDILSSIKSDSRYGNEKFYMYGFVSKGVEFGGKRWSSSNEEWGSFGEKNPLLHLDTWKVAANQLTWVLRHATVRYFANISQSGSITIQFRVIDRLDLSGSKGRSEAYNNISNVLGFGYHTLMGGNINLQTRATWTKNF